MRPKGTKLELVIPYCVSIDLHDMDLSILQVVCQREALPRTMLGEPREFGPHFHVNFLFYKDIINIRVLYPSEEL